MNALLHRRWTKSTLGVLAVAAIVTGVLWMREPDSQPSGIAAGGGGTPGAEPGADAAGAVPPLPDAKAFAHLPPAERINAETKARMEHNAAWREKLRSGDYSTLPPEALPQAPAPPLPTPK